MHQLLSCLRISAALVLTSTCLVTAAVAQSTCQDQYNVSQNLCTQNWDPSSCGSDVTCQIIVGQQQQNCINEAVAAYNLCVSAPVYTCSGFQSPFNLPLSLKSKTNRAIPLKAQLFMASTIVDSTMLSNKPPVVTISYSGSTTTQAIDETSLLQPVGQSSAGNQFQFDATTGTWWFNLNSSSFTAPGTYLVTLQSGDPTSYTVSPTCSGSFVRQ